MKNSTAPSKRTVKRGGNVIPALCNFLGTIMLLAVIATCIPLALPRVLGYESYMVVSGSMEPTIPVGSIIYVEPMAPEQIPSGEIIAFRDGETVVTHRVVENRFVVGEFVTKGDANAGEDMDTVDYYDVIGLVVEHYPYVGRFLSIYASPIGKAYVLCFAACGLMFNILAGRMRARNKERLTEYLEKKL